MSGKAAGRVRFTPCSTGETIGSYPLVFNVIANFDWLDAKPARP